MPSHRERRQLPYSPEQIFDLVADIEKYPEFIDWFVAVRIRRHDGSRLEVDQLVRFKGLHTHFTTQAVLDRPRQIDITTHDPPFKRFDQRWTFASARKSRTIVEYETTLELESAIMQHAMLLLFDERQVARDIVDAFARRAEQIYGKSPG